MGYRLSSKETQMDKIKQMPKMFGICQSETTRAIDDCANYLAYWESEWYFGILAKRKCIFLICIENNWIRIIAMIPRNATFKKM